MKLLGQTKDLLRPNPGPVWLETQQIYSLQALAMSCLIRYEMASCGLDWLTPPNGCRPRIKGGCHATTKLADT